MYHLIQARAIEPHVRLRICNQCWRRPQGSESLSPGTSRSCEAACPIFQALPWLVKRAELLDPMVASPEHALRELIVDYCHRTGGDLETLKHYGPGLAHIIADMVDKAG